MFGDRVNELKNSIFEVGAPEISEKSKSASEVYFRNVFMLIGGFFGCILMLLYLTGLYIMYGFTNFINWISRD